jgi:hypothetical protein
MRHKARLGHVGWFLLTLLLASQVQSQQNEQSSRSPNPQSSQPAELGASQPLTSEEAYTALKELEDKGTLVFAMLGEKFSQMMGAKSSGPLTKENCFGWRLSDNKRVIGESPLGVNLTFGFGSAGKQFQIIGFIHTERDISIADTPVKAGTYAIYASLDEIALNSKERWSSFSELHFRLKQPLASSFFENKNDSNSRRYSLAVEKNSLWLLIGDNKLPVQFSKN